MDELDAEAEKFEAACADNEDGAHSFSTEGTCACGAVEGMPFEPDPGRDPDGSQSAFHTDEVAALNPDRDLPNSNRPRGL